MIDIKTETKIKTNTACITVFRNSHNLFNINAQEAHNRGATPVTKSKFVRLYNLSMRQPNTVDVVKVNLSVDASDNVYHTITGIYLFTMPDYSTEPMMRKYRDPKHASAMLQVAFKLWLLHESAARDDPITFRVFDRYMRGYKTENNMKTLPATEWQIRVVADFDGDVQVANSNYEASGTDTIRHLLHSENINAWWALYKKDSDDCFNWVCDATTLEDMRIQWVIHTESSASNIKDIVGQTILVPQPAVRGTKL